MIDVDANQIKIKIASRCHSLEFVNVIRIEILCKLQKVLDQKRFDKKYPSTLFEQQQQLRTWFLDAIFVKKYIDFSTSNRIDRKIFDFWNNWKRNIKLFPEKT